MTRCRCTVRPLVLAALCSVPLHARAVGPDAPPEPEIAAPLTISEHELDGLGPGDPRRASVLVQLALRRHADALESEAQERVAHEVALGQWREGGGGPGRRPAPPLATPRSDALRGQAVEFAQRAAEEAPDSTELPPALLVGGIDAERVGRAREGLRLLGALIRRFAGSPHVPHAWIAVGEHHLRTGELTRARVAFDQAERGGTAAVRSWAARRIAELGRRADADAAGPALSAQTASAAQGKKRQPADARAADQRPPGSAAASVSRLRSRSSL